MERVVNFLKEAETYYLATMEGNQPRVRPFGTAHIFEGKLYIQTGKVKDVSKQIHANPKVYMTLILFIITRQYYSPQLLQGFSAEGFSRSFSLSTSLLHIFPWLFFR